MKSNFPSLFRHPEFERDLKKLIRKFPTLEDDLENFIDIQLNLFHKLKTDNRGIVRIPKTGFDNPPIYKARKFACRSLKGKGAMSGIRVIYAHFPEQDRIELIEIYYKGEKEREDGERIKKLYS